MARKYLDCRQVPSAKNPCSITMSGEEEDLLRAAVEHAVRSHGHKDTPDLRRELRGAMRELGGPEPRVHA